MRKLGVIPLAVLAAAIALVASGCGGDADRAVEPPAKAASTRAACPAAARAGWQRLANRIHASVYCPAWMPDPFDGVIGGRWNTIDSVSPDGSYLIGFIWLEAGSGELHVNLRGYPGRTRIPTCTDVNTVNGVTHRRKIQCFADPTGHRRVAGINATVYTANQDADRWHVLYAWRHDGSLYTLSQHVAEPLTYRKVVADLDRMLRSLVLVRPS
ncbi:MAG TPA: hypothetical protein VE596_01975 [Gaiellaceae bacterium]|nr:hypothetical protein [Gaiellaceae bacterium]